MTEPAADRFPRASFVVGSIVDYAGVARAKAVPRTRLDAFATAGMGASPSWNVFCADDQLAFTPEISVVGDLRLRIDESNLRDVGDGVVWAPADVFDQHGARSPLCTRGILERAIGALAADGIVARVGHELEFVLVGATPPGPWSAYGLGSVLERAGFAGDLLAAAHTAGLEIEQLHAEYGPDQFEISLAPRDPLGAADDVALARLLVSRVARAHGLRASFSPVPFAGGAGNGAHQHLSLVRDGVPVLSGGPGVHGLHHDGEAAIGGILHHLPDVMGVLAASALSGLRLQPGMWSGAHCCWGLENREAAVRLCAATAGNPHGASIEVKPIDPSANPYLSSAVILGMALDGIRRRLPLAEDVPMNPAELSDEARARAQVTLLPTDVPEMLARLQACAVARDVLGDAAIGALVSVRSAEHTAYAEKEPAEVAERLRFAWSA
ncbi:glutamine synthetase family protein [Microbacterium hominis]|uniref:Glutamine synthetase n=1 Tax=Microbacterium hominis TaxID=162426 RepID=A0A7D4U5Y5_9MICO|nr:glutamine synthetase family protein [Microbacterium hominis]QKJ20485.1 glutamine synthetase [Microbacterium hominis]